MKFYLTYNESSARDSTEEFDTIEQLFTWLQTYVTSHENTYPAEMRIYQGEPLFEVTG